MEIRGSSVFLAGSRFLTRVRDGELPGASGMADSRWAAADFPCGGEPFAGLACRRDGARMRPSAKPRSTAPVMIGNWVSLIRGVFFIRNSGARQHKIGRRRSGSPSSVPAWQAILAVFTGALSLMVPVFQQKQQAEHTGASAGAEPLNCIRASRAPPAAKNLNASPQF